MEIFDIGVTAKNCIFVNDTNAAGTARNVVFTGGGKLTAIARALSLPCGGQGFGYRLYL